MQKLSHTNFPSNPLKNSAIVSFFESIAYDNSIANMRLLKQKGNSHLNVLKVSDLVITGDAGYHLTSNDSEGCRTF